MRKSMTYGMMALFIMFLITANPSGTGENGREFIGWLSSGFDDTRAFVSSLVGDEPADEPAPIVNELGEVEIPTNELEVLE